jgi:hypothetical protein
MHAKSTVGYELKNARKELGIKNVQNSRPKSDDSGGLGSRRAANGPLGESLALAAGWQTASDVKTLCEGLS